MFIIQIKFFLDCFDCVVVVSVMLDEVFVVVVLRKNTVKVLVLVLVRVLIVVALFDVGL